MDKLDNMFAMREHFMNSLRESIPGACPNWPVDISSKENQQACRDVALRGVEEMFEALQHLKNWKPHRQTSVEEFDRDAFLEEVVDAFNYFFSLVIFMGFSADDLFHAYDKKDAVIHSRLKDGY